MRDDLPRQGDDVGRARVERKVLGRVARKEKQSLGELAGADRQCPYFFQVFDVVPVVRGERFLLRRRGIEAVWIPTLDGLEPSRL